MITNSTANVRIQHPAVYEPAPVHHAGVLGEALPDRPFRQGLRPMLGPARILMPSPDGSPAEPILKRCRVPAERRRFWVREQYSDPPLIEIEWLVGFRIGKELVHLSAMQSRVNRGF
jgi:hypothetical protein